MTNGDNGEMEDHARKGGRDGIGRRDEKETSQSHRVVRLLQESFFKIPMMGNFIVNNFGIRSGAN